MKHFRFSAIARSTLTWLALLATARASYTLHWVNNDLLGEVASFSVERSDNGGAFTVIASVPFSSSSDGLAFVYADPAGSDVTPSQYRVQAVNGSFRSTYSNIATNAPVFTTVPSSTSAIVTGAPPVLVSFTAAASGIPAPLFTWQVNNGVSWTTITDGVLYSGSTTGTLTLTNPTLLQAGYQYRAVARNASTPGGVNSAAATLTTYAQPAFTTQPSSQTASAGATVTFTVASSATPVSTYIWKVSTDGGATWTTISDGAVPSVSGATYAGSTTSTLTLTGTTTAMNNYQYEAVANNVVTTPATSLVATLNVNQAPTYLTQPSNVTLTAGATATFTPVLAGFPALSYQWQIFPPGGSSWSNLAGATSAILSVPGTTFAMNGTQYRLISTNSVAPAGVISNVVTLTVNTLPTFTTAPTALSVNAGTTATFTLALTGSPLPAIQWLESSDGGISFHVPSGSAYSGVTSPSLVIGNPGTGMNGYQYKATLSNAAGSTTSVAVRLTVNPVPAFTILPSAVTVSVGGGTTFTAAASNTNNYQWYFSTDGGTTFSTVPLGSGFSGGATNTLTLTGVSTGMNGYQFRVVASNATASATSAAVALTINVIAVTAPPSAQSIAVGSTGSFTTTATAALGLGYQWQISTDGTTWNNVSGAAFSGATSATLSVSPSDRTLNGDFFRCVITSGPLTQTTTSAQLTVSGAAFAFITQPTSQVVTAGNTAAFTAAATGTPTYQWQFSTDGSVWTNLSAGGAYSGVTGGTLAVATADLSLSGNYYRCVATSGSTSLASSSGQLTVNGIAPVFTANPRLQSVTAGASAAFSVAVAGIPIPALQWQVSTDGIVWNDVSGATAASFVVSGTTVAMSGYQYRCTAANLVGRVSSSSALLTVSAPVSSGPPPTSSGPSVAQSISFPAVGSVSTGTPVTLQATATSTLAITYTVLSGNATLVGSALTVNDVNPVVVQAAQPGDGTFLAAAPVTQTIVAVAPHRSATFFGVIGGASPSSYRGAIPAVSAGSFAGYLNPANTGGSLVGYLASQQIGFVASFSIANGAFSATTTGVGASGVSQNLTFVGTVANGVISGTIQELGISFSANADPASGSSSSLAGFYPAGGLYSVVGTQGQVFVLSVGSGGVSSGTGSVAGNGTFSVTTNSGASVTGAISSGGGSISATVALPGGGSANFSGVPGTAAPTITPSSAHPAAGATVVLSTPAVAGASYQWQYYGSSIAGATGSSYTISHIGEYQGGLYSVIVTNGGASVSSNPAAVAVSLNSRLINLSALASAGPTSAAGLYVGYVVGGNGAKNILLRANGPALAAFGVANAQTAVSLTLFDANQVAIAANSGWSTPSTPGTSTAATVGPASLAQMAAVGAFPLVPGSLDSAIVANTGAGLYTVVVNGTATGGTALAEAYDLDLASSTAYLSNLSARAPVSPGHVLTAGFVVSGSTSMTVLLRAVGPALSSFGVPAVLQHPRLTLYDGSQAVISTNEGWGNASVAGPSNAAAAVATASPDLMTRVYAFTIPTGSGDSAMIATLPPGLYTAQIDASDGGSGAALVEIYNLP